MDRYTKSELYNNLKNNNIKNVSKLNKKQLYKYHIKNKIILPGNSPVNPTTQQINNEIIKELNILGVELDDLTKNERTYLRRKISRRLWAQLNKQYIKNRK